VTMMNACSNKVVRLVLRASMVHAINAESDAGVTTGSSPPGDLSIFVGGDLSVVAELGDFSCLAVLQRFIVPHSCFTIHPLSGHLVPSTVTVM